ncbi:MAG: SdrD B-like domain-containing protein [Pirellulales bacterium]
MGLLTKISRLGSWLGDRRFDGPRSFPPRPRICRFEQIEPRQLLAADLLQVGSVYYEQAAGDDLQPNILQFSFEGGAPGTQLTRIIIDGDKDGRGISSGDVFFDTAPGGYGAFRSNPLEIISHEGFQVLSTRVVDGGMRMVIDLAGFDAGEKLVLSIDVDEFQFVDEVTHEIDINPVAEGAEFQRSKFITTFVAPHYQDLTASVLFWDAFNENFAAAEAKTGTHLDLPPDRYSSQVDLSDLTAGAVATAEQVPLPNNLSGVVYLDHNLNNHQDAGDPGLGGVSLTLLKYDGTRYVSTGLVTVTDTLGNYNFDNLEIGKFRVVETQPGGYLSVGATPGTVKGQTRGIVVTSDILSEIELLGGENSIRNDFAEYLPVSISGFVHVDTTGDCPNPENPPLEGVTIELLNAAGQVIDTTTTNAQGYYIFDNLKPGTYGVHEIQPAAYLDGDEHVGSAGGTLADDLITSVVLASGVDAVDYNFCELLPVSISGYVHVSDTGDCLNDPTAQPLSGVTIYLLDGAGNVIGTTQTNDDGFYIFDNLPPGTYGVREVQPEGYLDGLEYVGSAGGTLADDLITGVVLISGVDAVEYDFCELPPSGISGYVYLDLDNDGVKDPGEVGIGGVTVFLKDAGGRPTGATAVTDANGYYQFTGLYPGTYGVGELQPAGYLDGLDSPGSAGGFAMNPGDMITGAVLAAGVVAVDYNFGELLPVSISGYVHVDDTGDCENNPDALPLSGVTIHLLDSAGNIIATTQTNDDGFYVFNNLPPGTYGVREIQPAGFLDGDEHVGSAGGTLFDDLVTNIVLTAGINGVNYNFCEIPPDEQIILPPALGAPEPPPPPGAFFAPPPPPPVPIPDSPFLVPRILTRAGGQLYTWHLSVIDAGFPRGAPAGESVAQLTATRPEDKILWRDDEMDDVEWTMLDEDGERPTRRKLRFGMRGGIPIAGDFNGDGTYEIGVFKDGYWFIDLNDNGVWDTGDLWAKLGHAGDKPVTGDWDGDGKTDIGIYGPAWSGDPRAIRHEPGLPDPYNEHHARHKNIPRPSDKTAVGHRTLKRTADGQPRTDLIDHVFLYGTPGDHPIVGDWNGDGIDTIGIFRYGMWRRDADGDGRRSDADYTNRFGQSGDLPLAGDFNGDGVEELAVFRDGTWYIDTNGNGVIDGDDQVIQLGGSGDAPIVGDWNGDGRAEIGVFHDRG